MTDKKTIVKEEESKEKSASIKKLVGTVIAVLFVFGVLIGGYLGYFKNYRINYIILIDNSKSVVDYLDHIKDVAREIIKGAKKGDSFCVLTLDTEPGTLDSNTDTGLKLIESIHPTEQRSDFKHLFDITRNVINADQSNIKRRYRITFISDGKCEPEGCIYLNGLIAEGALAQSLAIYYKFLEDKLHLPETAKVFCFAIGEDPDETIMKKIAEDAGGKYYRIIDIDDFKKTFQFSDKI